MIDPVNSRCTSLPSAGSSGLTSSVMTGWRPSVGEVRDQPVADLSARTRNQDDRLAYHCDSPVTAGRYTLKLAPLPRSLSTAIAPPV